MLRARASLLHHRVDDHVARPGIERKYIFGPRASGNHGHVRNSADVQRHSPASRSRYSR